jgi:peptidyl-prolyl cis-trans isomerase SurA
VELKAAIESGQMTFAQAADKHSQGPGVGHGGDIGFLAWKDLAPEWNEALRGLKPGQIAQPVRIQDFEGLLQVVSLKEGEELPLDAVREQIYQSLHEGKFEKVFQEYLKRQREKAVIEYKNL